MRLMIFALAAVQFSDAIFLALAYTSVRHACTHLAFVEETGRGLCSADNVLRNTYRDEEKIVAYGWFSRFL